MALNQKTRSLVTLAGMAALATGAAMFAYYGVHEKQARDQERKEQDEKLFSFEPGKVIGLAVVAKGETTRLARAKDGSGWGIISPVTATADDGAVDGLIERLVAMKRKALVEESSADLAKYGLQKPSLKITAQLEDGSERVLRAGAEIKFDDSAYVALDDSADVLQAEGGFKWALEKSTFDLRDKRIAPFDDERVTGLDVRLDATRYILTKERGIWRVQSPVVDRADETTVGRILGALRDLRAVRFQTDLATPAEEQKYGLDQPTLEVVLTFGSTARTTIAVGQAITDSGPKTYARRKETTTIAEIAGSALRDLSVQDFDLRHKSVLDFERVKVAKAILDFKDESVTLERAKDADAGFGEEWRVAAPSEATAKKRKMSSVLWALSSMRASGFAAEGAEDLAPFGLDKPARTLRLLGEDGKELAALLVGKEEGEKFFVKSGANARILVVPASGLNELPRTRADVVEQPKADSAVEGAATGR